MRKTSLGCIPERNDHAPTGFEDGDPCQCGAKKIIKSNGEYHWEGVDQK